MTPWIKPQDKLPDEDCEVELKYHGAGVVDDASYFKDREMFSHSAGNIYHIEKKNDFKEYNYCKGEFTGACVTHYRIISPTEE